MTKITTAMLLVGLLLGLGAHDAGAQNKAAAEAAFKEAKKLMAAKNYAEACPKFKASYDADPGLGALLNLADCHELLGLIASAWAEFSEVAETAKKRADNREKYARDRALALEPRLAHLVIHKPVTPIEKLKVRNDDSDVTALLESSLPIDPGVHTITAEAPGREPWETTVTIEGEGDAEEVTIPDLAKAKVVIRKGPDDDRPRLVVDASRRNNRRIIAAATGGVGLIATGIGLFFGKKAFDDWDASRATGLCDDENICTEEGQDFIDSANSNALKSDIFVGIGLAAIAAGGVLWFTAPDAERRMEGGSAGGVSLVPVVSGDAVGGMITGRF